MTRQQLYNKIKAEAIKEAEQELRQQPMPSGDRATNPDWHPYYCRVNRDGESKGLHFTMVVRDGEIEFFKRKKIKVPDFKTPAVNGLQSALQKYKTDLVMVEIIDNINKTEGYTAEKVETL